MPNGQELVPSLDYNEVLQGRNRYSLPIPTNLDQSSWLLPPMSDSDQIDSTQKSPGRLSRRRFLKYASLGTLSVGVGCGLYAWRVEPHWVQITQMRMPLRNLPQSLIGKRIVQLSDLHIGPVVDNDYLRKVLGGIESLEPDYLILTGDFMTSVTDEQIELVVSTLKELPLQKVTTIGILGNHDYGKNFRQLATANKLDIALRRLGITMLRNDVAEIDGIQFAGIDDLWAGNDRVEATVANLSEAKPTIMLAHNPDLVDLEGWQSFEGWILSGHTHGGQCRLPWLGAPVVPVRNKTYVEGHHKLGKNRDLYINRGLGYKERIRFGVRPEVTIFELVDI